MLNQICADVPDLFAVLCPFHFCDFAGSFSVTDIISIVSLRCLMCGTEEIMENRKERSERLISEEVEYSV